nr:hypothetical protein [uncultured Dysosmobacter sp.]
MYHGAVLDRVNTLRTWGLILLDDLEEGAPELKTNYQDVGGMDGMLNLSYAVTGRPVYGTRQVSFTLCRPWAFAAQFASPPPPMATVWADLMGRYHGREVQLTLPTDPYHHYTGVVEIGPVSGQARDRIPVAMTADPWRERNEPTRIMASLARAAQTIYLPNETRYITPTITVDAVTRLQLGGKDYQLDPGTRRVLDMELAPGENILQASLVFADAGHITVEYTEAVL